MLRNGDQRIPLKKENKEKETKRRKRGSGFKEMKREVEITDFPSCEEMWNDQLGLEMLFSRHTLREQNFDM